MGAVAGGLGEKIYKLQNEMLKTATFRAEDVQTADHEEESPITGSDLHNQITALEQRLSQKEEQL